MTAKKTFSKKYQKIFKATSAQNKIQREKNKNNFQRGKRQTFFKATGAKNNFHSNKSKKSFSKRQEQKIIFAAISAKKKFKEKSDKKYFQSDTRPRNILKAKNTTNTLQSNKCQKK